jgi:hypothetical protein
MKMASPFFFSFDIDINKLTPCAKRSSLYQNYVAWRKKKYFLFFLILKTNVNRNPTHTKRNKREKYVNFSNGERYLLGTGRGSLNKKNPSRARAAGRVASRVCVCVDIFSCEFSLSVFSSYTKEDGRGGQHIIGNARASLCWEEILSIYQTIRE